MSANIDRSIARCYTKRVITRDQAITEAERLGYPVVPYKCPNGWNHWHVGASQAEAQIFYKDRPRWERKSRNHN